MYRVNVSSVSTVYVSAFVSWRFHDKGRTKYRPRFEKDKFLARTRLYYSMKNERIVTEMF